MRCERANAITTPPLVAVAHGSRDPRSAATVNRLLDTVRTLRPDLTVRGAFLDLSVPRLGDVLSGLHHEGHREVVVVPLLLGAAYHARVDVPALVAESLARLPRLSVSIADVLGPDPRIESAALSRLTAAGVRLDDQRLGVVVAGAGSAHQPANAAVSEVARRWAGCHPWVGALAAFASTADPDVPTAIRRLRARGADRIAVASWFVAPGRLPDRIAAQAGLADPTAIVAAPLGRTLAEVVLDRFHTATTPSLQYA